MANPKVKRNDASSVNPSASFHVEIPKPLGDNLFSEVDRLVEILFNEGDTDGFDFASLMGADGQPKGELAELNALKEIMTFIDAANKKPSSKDAAPKEVSGNSSSSILAGLSGDPESESKSKSKSVKIGSVVISDADGEEDDASLESDALDEETSEDTFFGAVDKEADDELTDGQVDEIYQFFMKVFKASMMPGSKAAMQEQATQEAVQTDEEDDDGLEFFDALDDEPFEDEFFDAVGEQADDASSEAQQSQTATHDYNLAFEGAFDDFSLSNPFSAFLNPVTRAVKTAVNAAGTFLEDAGEFFEQDDVLPRSAAGIEQLEKAGWEALTPEQRFQKALYEKGNDGLKAVLNELMTQYMDGHDDFNSPLLQGKAVRRGVDYRIPPQTSIIDVGGGVASAERRNDHSAINVVAPPERGKDPFAEWEEALKKENSWLAYIIRFLGYVLGGSGALAYAIQAAQKAAITQGVFGTPFDSWSEDVQSIVLYEYFISLFANIPINGHWTGETFEAAFKTFRDAWKSKNENVIKALVKNKSGKEIGWLFAAFSIGLSSAVATFKQGENGTQGWAEDGTWASAFITLSGWARYPASLASFALRFKGMVGFPAAAMNLRRLVMPVSLGGSTYQKDLWQMLLAAKFHSEWLKDHLDAPSANEVNSNGQQPIHSELYINEEVQRLRVKYFQSNNSFEGGYKLKPGIDARAFRSDFIRTLALVKDHTAVSWQAAPFQAVNALGNLGIGLYTLFGGVSSSVVSALVSGASALDFWSSWMDLGKSGTSLWDPLLDFAGHLWVGFNTFGAGLGTLLLYFNIFIKFGLKMSEHLQALSEDWAHISSVREALLIIAKTVAKLGIFIAMAYFFWQSGASMGDQAMTYGYPEALGQLGAGVANFYSGLLCAEWLLPKLYDGLKHLIIDLPYNKAKQSCCGNSADDKGAFDHFNEKLAGFMQDMASAESEHGENVAADVRAWREGQQEAAEQYPDKTTKVLNKIGLHKVDSANEEDGIRQEENQRHGLRDTHFCCPQGGLS